MNDKKKKFDLVMPLGYSCQTSNAYVCLYGENPIPLLFNWVRIDHYEYLLKYLKDPNRADNICSKGLKVCLEPERKNILYHDNYFHFFYHTKAKYDDWIKMTEEEKKNDCLEVISRIKHLSDKSIELLQSNNRILFWFNFRFFEEDMISAENASDEIHDSLFKLVKNKKSEIIYFVDSREYKLLKRYRKKYNICNIKKFAPRIYSYLFNSWKYYIYMKKYIINGVSLSKKRIIKYNMYYSNIPPYKNRYKYKILNFLINILLKFKKHFSILVTF